VYIFGVFTVALGQAVVIYGVGGILLAALKRIGLDGVLSR
jgi:hypothetical protein